MATNPNQTQEMEVPPNQNGYDAKLFDLQEYLLFKSRTVDAALDFTVPVRQPSVIYQAMRYSLLAEGKRIHPILCISACELIGGSEEVSLPTACAMEMVHTASLIHDDLPCMDDDELRRGIPTNHKVFGEDMAILAGDALYALAVEHVAKYTRGVSGEKILGVIAELSRAVGSEGMVAGQFLDLTNEGNPNLDVQELKDIHLRKTAILAECSTVCGAILAGAEDEQIESLRHYGRALGHLYQVVDDVLDFTKSSENLGLTPRKELFRDRATYPKLLGLQKSKEFAEQLRCRAKEYLVNFGENKAAPLLGLVDLVAGRIHSVE